MPWRWSLPGVAFLAAAQAPLVRALGAAFGAAASYFLVTVLWRTAAVFVQVWLAGTVGQLERARRELAQNAVLCERLHLDDRLQERWGPRWPRSWPRAPVRGPGPPAGRCDS